MFAYVILRTGVEDSEDTIINDLISIIKTKIGSIAIPERFLVSTLVV